MIGCRLSFPRVATAALNVVVTLALASVTPAADVNPESDSTKKGVAVIRIRAIDQATRKPIQEFNVRVQNSRQREPGEPRTTLSAASSEQGVNVRGEENEFKMGNLQENTPLEVTVRAEGYEPTVLLRVIAVRSDRARIQKVVLTAEQLGNYEVVAGKLRQRDGEPVIGAILTLIVGTVNPVSQQARLRGASADRWSGYHWVSIRNGILSRSRSCLQVLTTSTDQAGNFQFDRVRKDGIWLELVHQQGDVASGRFPDLRVHYPDSLRQLDLSAATPSSVKLLVNRESWPTADSVRLEAPFYRQFPDCLKMPFSSMSHEIDGETDAVKFTGLPGGTYRISLRGKPTPLKNGGSRTAILQTYTIELPEEEDMEGDL